MGLRLGEAGIGDVLVDDSEVKGELVQDGDADAGTDGKAEAEVLALGFGSAGGVGEEKADARFKVRDDGPIRLDKVIARTEEAAGKPRIGSLESGGKHAAEEEFGVAPIPPIVPDFIQLPADGDELRQVKVIVGVVDGEKAGGFGGQGDDILTKERISGGFGQREGFRWGRGRLLKRAR